MESENKTLWKLLWDYDPNGLLVVDTGLMVRVVNPAGDQQPDARGT